MHRDQNPPRAFPISEFSDGPLPSIDVSAVAVVDDPAPAEATEARTATVAEPEPPPRPTDAVSLAIAQRAEQAALARAENEEARRLVMARYIGLLERSDNPQPDDATCLVETMNDQSISAEQLAADADLIRKVHELEGYIADREAAIAEWVRVSVEYSKRAIERRHEAELAAAEQIRRVAMDRQSDSLAAPRKLRELARQRPELFDNSGQEPSLLSQE